MITLIVVLLCSCATEPEQLGFSKQQWQEMSEKEHQKTRTAYQPIEKSFAALKIIYNGPDIQVTVKGGVAMTSPFFRYYNFSTIQFQIQPGKCRCLQLINWEQTHLIDLSACYNGLTLSLDTSCCNLTKGEGTLLLTYNPLWKRSFTYKGLSSSGYVRLKNINITIKVIHNPVSVNVDNSST